MLIVKRLAATGGWDQDQSECLESNDWAHVYTEYPP